MKKILNQIKNYFLNIDYTLIWKSTKEVFWLSIISFLPLLLSISFQWFKIEDINKVLLKVVHPSEILAFCLSFLAPSIFFLKKMIGKDYKLPHKDFFFFSTFIMYIIAIFFVIIIKNNIDSEVINNLNDYFGCALLFLLVTIVYRIYSTFHQSKSSDYFDNKKSDQDNFNKSFKNIIHGR